MSELPADADGDGSLAALEEEVLRRLLERAEVQAAVSLAREGKSHEAVSSLLVIIQGLLAEAKPKAVAKRVRTRPQEEKEQPETEKDDKTGEKAEEKRSVRPRTDEYWLEECSRTVEADRLRTEEQARAKALRAEQASVSAAPEIIDVEVDGTPLFWRVDLPEVLKVLSKRGILPSNFLPVVKPHVTLLYLGGDLSEPKAAQRAEMSVEDFRKAKKTLENLKGRQVAIRMTEIVIEENVACALVQLPEGIPCGSKVPHLTLGTRQGVPARHANDLLEEIALGRTSGITRMKLPKPKELRGTLDLETSATYAGRT
ncbi:unnamed protein product [Durusdinium trenchii]|uniref:tRNA ligase phosphodiesterase domain-containing protein n=1 Tax=Durusdinium trenchii TaxID=1381693 RepID=A0ABP0R466_9DINO